MRPETNLVGAPSFFLHWNDADVNLRYTRVAFIHNEVSAERNRLKFVHALSVNYSSIYLFLFI